MPSQEAFSGPFNTLEAADSLFAKGQFGVAESLYIKEFKNNKKSNPNLLLKLAFLAEKRNDYTRSLYYLSCLAEIAPSVSLFQKMNTVAVKYGLKGYEFNDFSYFQIAYRKYGDLIPIALLSLAVYVFVVMWIKVKNRERVFVRHKWALVVYLLALLTLLNVPFNYGYGVVDTAGTYLREYPSAASPVVAKLQKGHKVMIIGSRDRWNVIIWDKELVFIRDHDLLRI